MTRGLYFFLTSPTTSIQSHFWILKLLRTYLELVDSTLRSSQTLHVPPMLSTRSCDSRYHLSKPENVLSVSQSHIWFSSWNRWWFGKSITASVIRSCAFVQSYLSYQVLPFMRKRLLSRSNAVFRHHGAFVARNVKKRLHQLLLPPPLLGKPPRNPRFHREQLHLVRDFDAIVPLC